MFKTHAYLRGDPMNKRSFPEEKNEWYEMIPYGYGIVDPGEWFWLAYRYPSPREEPEPLSSASHTTEAVVQPSIRINFYPRR